MKGSTKTKLLSGLFALALGIGGGDALSPSLALAAESHHGGGHQEQGYHAVHRDFHHDYGHGHGHYVVPNGYSEYPGPYQNPNYVWICNAHGHHCRWLPRY